MSKFITVTDVTFLANPNNKNKTPEKICLNSGVIEKFSLENKDYFYNGKACTVIRTTCHGWGYVVTESIEDILNQIKL